MRNILDKKDKRGSIIDIFYILVVLFMASVAGVLLFYTWGEVSPTFNSTVQGMDMISDGTKDTLSSGIGRADESTDLLDSLFVAVFVGLLISIIITAFLVDVHPAFMIVYFVVLIFAVILSVLFSNGFESFADSSTLASTVTSDFTMTQYLMDKLPMLTLIVGLVGMVIMFAKMRRAGGDIG